MFWMAVAVRATEVATQRCDWVDRILDRPAPRITHPVVFSHGNDRRGCFRNGRTLTFRRLYLGQTSDFRRLTGFWISPRTPSTRLLVLEP